MALTPHEKYEQMLNGGELSGMDALHAKTAETILRRQAEWLTEEDCVEGFSATPEGATPWTLTVRFTDGGLSASAQRTLRGMFQNAHRSEMIRCGPGAVQVAFYVYTMEEDGATG